MSLKEKYADEIAALLGRYAQKRSAVLALLYIAQDEYGFLTDRGVREVAEALDMPPTNVFEVAGFYSLLYEQPVGKWVLQVCDDVPCCFTGAEELVTALEQQLGVLVDATTPDGMFTLQRVKCLADCNRAPMLQANLEYHGHITPDKVDGLLHDLRARAAGGERLSVSGRLAER